MNISGSSFYNLQLNLSEIYAALHDKGEANNLPLYASSPCTVYYQGSWGGMLKEKYDSAWRWIKPSCEHYLINDVLDRIFTLFDETVRQVYLCRQKRIWDHMLQIEKTLKVQLSAKEVLNQRNRIKKFVLEELKGSVETEASYLVAFAKRDLKLLTADKIRTHRQTIVNFHQATYIFWSLFVKNSQGPNDLCLALNSYIKPASILFDLPLFKAMKKEGRWVQVEGIMQQSIPVALISKLQDLKSLTVEENRCLKSWVQALNQFQDSLSLKLLSNVFNEMIMVINLEGSSTLTLQNFILWLDQQGCQILHCEDRAHMDWREKLKPGSIVECNGKKFTLGLQVSPDKIIKDEFKIFEVANYPNYIIKIANNLFRLLSEDKQSQSEQTHWGVRLVEKIKNIETDAKKPLIDGLDREGRCVMLEKLCSTFDSHVWESEEAKLTKKDEKPALVLANHLYCMQEWRASAENLSLSHLMWDQNGDLKSTRLLKKGLPNYNEWESLCINAAKGNLAVLNFLINVSKLSEHKIAKYYRGAVESTLKKGKTDLLSRPLPNGHQLEIYSQRVKELCIKALELRNTCLAYVIASLRKKGQYSYQKEAELQKEVADRMIQSYRASCTPGQLPSNWEAEIVESYLNFNNWDTSLSTYSNHAKYYQEQHDLMMNCNKSVLNGKPVTHNIVLKVPK